MVDSTFSAVRLARYQVDKMSAWIRAEELRPQMLVTTRVLDPAIVGAVVSREVGAVECSRSCVKVTYVDDPASPVLLPAKRELWVDMGTHHASEVQGERFGKDQPPLEPIRRERMDRTGAKVSLWPEGSPEDLRSEGFEVWGSRRFHVVKMAYRELMTGMTLIFGEPLGPRAAVTVTVDPSQRRRPTFRLAGGAKFSPMKPDESVLVELTDEQLEQVRNWRASSHLPPVEYVVSYHRIERNTDLPMVISDLKPASTPAPLSEPGRPGAALEMGLARDALS